jgi:hypothetical protein
LRLIILRFIVSGCLFCHVSGKRNPFKVEKIEWVKKIIGLPKRAIGNNSEKTMKQQWEFYEDKPGDPSKDRIWGAKPGDQFWGIKKALCFLFQAEIQVGSSCARRKKPNFLFLQLQICPYSVEGYVICCLEIRPQDKSDSHWASEVLKAVFITQKNQSPQRSLIHAK